VTLKWRLGIGMAACWLWLPRGGIAQQRDTSPPSPSPQVVLPPITVSATRSTLPLSKTPRAVQLVDKRQISAAKPTWGLDEALSGVPGVFVANRYNFSLDQRIAIRGFGSRAQFAVRGIKVLVDGIPQTLPDGQGQLTNLDLGAVDHIEVLRGSSSALFGNASGGVVSIWTDPTTPDRLDEALRVVAGRSERDPNRTWSKWQSTTRFRAGPGNGFVNLSRLGYDGERDHSGADLRNLNTRFQVPLGGWTLSTMADVGDDPRADNPGSLTLAEMQANRDSAPLTNLRRNAGKDVSQGQLGVTVRRQSPDGGETALTVFGLTRDLKNPQTFAYIALNRLAYGARVTVTRPVPLGRLPQRVTAGFDVQGQRDDRVNYNYVGLTAQRDTSRQLDQLENVTEIGPFVQSAVELTPRVTVTGGMRYDWVRFSVRDRLTPYTVANPDDSGRRLMAALSGSLGVAVATSDAVTVYASLGSSFETPTTTELANRPDTAGGFNPTLQPQRALNYELGARGSLDGRLTWNAAVYRADVTDELISYGVPASQRVFFRNAGSSRHRGVELGATVQVVPGVDLTGAYTVSDFRYRDYTVSTFDLRGRPLPGVPRFAGRFEVSARPAFARGGWVEVETQHSSGYFVTDTLGVRTTPWWATNLRLGWEGTAGTVRLAPFVGINNLFNRLYVGSVVINAAAGRYYEPAPGRSTYIGFALGAAR
jgi:iron complex outermembrane recepter protein